MNDPFDSKIDALLASQPLRPHVDFANRVCTAAKADSATRVRRPLARWIVIALPTAAAIALTFSLLQIDDGSKTAKTLTSSLTTAEAQEIFLLEESLTGLSATGASGFASRDLLSTLEALYLEI